MRPVVGIALWLAGCPRPVPEHLRIEPGPDRTTQTAPITDLGSAVRAMIGRDPLARAPTLPTAEVLAPIAGAEPLTVFVGQVDTLEHGEGVVERVLQQVEDDWRATAAVPFARGYRLRLAENLLSNPAGDPEAMERQVVGLITPLSTASQSPTLPRRPLEWLGGEEQVRDYAERWVLASWLAGPDIPVEAVREALSAPQFDHLRDTPTGRLVAARASGATGDAEAGLADVRRATVLALTQVAADRDAEQARWAEQKQAATAELGGDPIPTLLARAVVSLTAAAGDDRATGGALLAVAAQRWVGTCPTPPCTGVDRVETMGFAATWAPEIAELTSVWQVIALKETLDSLEVARDTPLFPKVAVDLADALLGTGAGPIEAGMLRKQRPDPQVWLAVARAVGTEGITDWEGTRVALGLHLQRSVDESLGLTSDPGVREILERIRSRAVP